MIPALLAEVGIEAIGAEALSPELLRLAKFASGKGDGGGLYVPLRSSWLEGFEYDPLSGDLTVHLQNGSSYTYPGTSPATAAGLASAASPGSYYDENIKLGTKAHAAPQGRMFRIHAV